MLNTSPFSDPLAGWPNDDILLSEDARNELGTAHPQLLRVFYWEQLCKAFAEHDKPAGRGKKWNHWQGMASVLLSGLGVVLLSIQPLLPALVSGCVLKIALISMLAGGGIGVLTWGPLRSRSHWLAHRFWTERLRQLHFQLLANNVALVAAAMTDDDALKELEEHRHDLLTNLYKKQDDPRARIRAILRDRTEGGTWIRHEWKAEPAPPPASDDVKKVLEGLYQLRIGVQVTYAANNLGSDIYSAPTRSKVLKLIVNLCFFFVAVVAGLGLVAAGTGQPVIDLDAISWTIFAAVLSAIGLMAQSVNQGLQNDAELDRYEWYADELEQSQEDFEQASDAQGKVKALRRLEQASYRELRLFLRAHSAARFTG